MTISTVNGVAIDAEYIHNYFNNMIHCFFKILPLKEEHSETLCDYIRSLQLELTGFSKFAYEVGYDSRLISLLATLQYFVDKPNCKVEEVRREVFRMIRICKMIAGDYANGGVSDGSVG